MTDTIYYVVSGLLILIIMAGIFLMSKVKYAKLGNNLSAIAVFAAVIITLLKYDVVSEWIIYIFIGVGALVGIILAYKVKMIQMPQLIALLNGLGGLASLIVGAFAYFGVGVDSLNAFSDIVAIIAVIVGTITFVGSIVAALKLHQVITQKPIKIKFYSTIISFLFLLQIVAIIISPFGLIDKLIFVLSVILIATLFSISFTIRIGGADMPITISLLNSFSGVAGAISGLAIGDILLVAIGGIVGASGLILTEIMCKAMNKRLVDILLGKTSSSSSFVAEIEEVVNEKAKRDFKEVYKNSKSVIIVPGYGMAVAQAQQLVKALADKMKEEHKTVRYAIHPVAGRMPGHMNVLLAEAHVDYEDLYDMDMINGEFINTDLVIVVGANDVINPKAKTHEGTPIYGMPILDVELAKDVFIFNYDKNPGYSGVTNSLYNKDNVQMFLGDAKETLKKFINDVK